jgi:hypothetical protein
MNSRGLVERGRLAMNVSPDASRPPGKATSDNDNSGASNRTTPESRPLIADGIPVEDGLVIWIRNEYETVRLIAVSTNPADTERIVRWVQSQPALLELAQRAIALLPDADEPLDWTL